MILDELHKTRKLSVIIKQPLIIYYKDKYSHSECYDTSKNKPLDINDIDDSYGLDITDNDNDLVEVMIPKDARCILKRLYPNFDCAVIYKNIECNLLFENDDIDEFFEIIEE